MNDGDTTGYPLLATISSPADLKALPLDRCSALASEIRSFIVDAVTRTGGHLGSNLGAVELTLAMHRVFDSPTDVLLFDTGHQSYVHKMITGRCADFKNLKGEGGLSGYPNRAESVHDIIENSHASTALSYAHGIATAFKASGEDSRRRVVALIGDGALTGGLAYEALNNLGNADARVCIVLNDNGRSYAPTVSKLSESLTQLRLHPSYGAIKQRVGHVIGEIPGVGPIAGQSLRSLTSALRELVEPHVFFEALGIRYTGPIDGHDVGALEQALMKVASYNGPIVLHVLTKKGKGYAPAEADEVQHLHDMRAQASERQLSAIGGPGSLRDSGAVAVGPRSLEASYTEAFSQAIVEEAARNRNIVAITAAMPGPTGLLAFEARYPDRFIDVGIAEAHAMVAAAGMTFGGLRPVVAIYSTFLSRCFDQENLDVGLHNAPVVICADRAGITGDDGPSHHGILDMVLGLCVPNMTIFAPAEPAEIAPMLRTALELEGPSLIRYPKTPCPERLAGAGEGLRSRLLRAGDGRVVLVGVGKMAARALEAAALLELQGVDATVYDPRVVRPLDPELVAACAAAELVVTVEDGLVHGGAGHHLAEVLDGVARAAGARAALRRHLGVPTTYIPHAKPDAILTRLGLDAAGIAAATAAEFALLTGIAPTAPSVQTEARAGGASPSVGGRRGRVAR